MYYYFNSIYYHYCSFTTTTSLTTTPSTRIFDFSCPSRKRCGCSKIVTLQEHLLLHADRAIRIQKTQTNRLHGVKVARGVRMLLISICTGLFFVCVEVQLAAILMVQITTCFCCCFTFPSFWSGLGYISGS